MSFLNRSGYGNLTGNTTYIGLSAQYSTQPNYVGSWVGYMQGGALAGNSYPFTAFGSITANSPLVGMPSNVYIWECADHYYGSVPYLEFVLINATSSNAFMLSLNGVTYSTATADTYSQVGNRIAWYWTQTAPLVNGVQYMLEFSGK